MKNLKLMCFLFLLFSGVTLCKAQITILETNIGGLSEEVEEVIRFSGHYYLLKTMNNRNGICSYMALIPIDNEKNILNPWVTAEQFVDVLATFQGYFNTKFEKKRGFDNLSYIYITKGCEIHLIMLESEPYNGKHRYKIIFEIWHVKSLEQLLRETSVSWKEWEKRNDIKTPTQGPIIAKKETFIDRRDGKTYDYVKIGKHIWMAENLKYNTKDSKQSKDMKTELLYSWNDAVNVCPRGWHLPDYEEWQLLIKTSGGEINAGKRLKSISGWSDYGNGTDEYGFSALPAGYYYSSGGVKMANSGSGWWCSTVGSGGYSVYYFRINFTGSEINSSTSRKSGFFSVRCVKD